MPLLEQNQQSMQLGNMKIVLDLSVHVCGFDFHSLAMMAVQCHFLGISEFVECAKNAILLVGNQMMLSNS